MPPHPAFAQMDFSHMNAFQIRPEHIMTYMGVTFAFLFLFLFFNRQPRPLGTNLILWGILVVILAGGYTLVGVPMILMVTPALTKIGFLLVLGGLAWSLLVAVPNSTTSPAKESEHV